MNKTFTTLFLVFSIIALPASAQHLISDSLLFSMTQSQVDSYMVVQGIPANPLIHVNNGVSLYKIVYSTRNAQDTGNTIASGLLVVPEGVDCPVPLACYNHGTIADRREVPSRLSYETPIGIILASDGYAMALPDYLGLGDSPGMHPYVHAKSEATATIDMLRASREFAAANGYLLNDQIFLTGYSQGGHACMATHKEMQLHYAGEFDVTASAPLSGPYDISGAQKDLLTSNDPYPDPSYLPFVMFSYQYVYGNLYTNLSDVIVSPYDSLLPPLFDGFHNTGDINAVMPNVPKNIIDPLTFVTFGNDPTHPFNVALRDNDTWRGWVPEAPMKIVYCEGDNAVTYHNAIVARDSFLAAGATTVQAISGGAGNDHGGCVTPALISTKLFFDLYKVVENALSVTVTGEGESVAGANDAGAVVHVSGGTGYMVEWSNGATDTIVTGLADGSYNVTVTDGNGCGKVRTVTLGATGINTLPKLGVNIYPNPAANGITVTLNSAINQTFTISLSDITGRQVKVINNFNGNNLFIERGTLAKGVYILEIQGEQVVRKKVIFE
jgi:hypothetical protein